jgi:hypothetical protein
VDWINLAQDALLWWVVMNTNECSGYMTSRVVLPPAVSEAKEVTVGCMALVYGGKLKLSL